MDLPALLDLMVPLLAYIGAMSLVVVSLLAGFWPWILNPLISWLTRQRDRRARKRQDAARRKAGRFFDWSRK